MAQKRIRSDLWVAISDFSVGHNVWVRAGNTVVDGHPILKDRLDKFRPFTPTFDISAALPLATATEERGIAATVKAEAAASEPAGTSGFARHAELVAQAKSLGLKASGTNAELESAIEAEQATP